MKDEDLKFEDLLDRIAEIARALEEDDLSLEESIKQFEYGTKLLNRAKQVLKDAHARIEVLTQNATQEVAPEEFLSEGHDETTED